jgi:hypothetical protein
VQDSSQNAGNTSQPQGGTRRMDFECIEAWRHWFSVMGTFLPFEIITYAI